MRLFLFWKDPCSRTDSFFRANFGIVNKIAHFTNPHLTVERVCRSKVLEIGFLGDVGNGILEWSQFSHLDLCMERASVRSIPITNHSFLLVDLS